MGGGCGELAGLGAWCKMVLGAKRCSRAIYNWCNWCKMVLVQYTIGAIGAMCNCNWAFAFDDDKDGKNNDDDVEQPIIFTFQCLKPTVQGIFTRLVS